MSVIREVVAEVQGQLNQLQLVFQFELHVNAPLLKGQINAIGGAIQAVRKLKEKFPNGFDRWELEGHEQRLIRQVQELNHSRHLNRLNLVDLAENIRALKDTLKNCQRMFSAEELAGQEIVIKGTV